MSDINQLDENEIRQYPELRSGLGQQVSNALRDYNARLIDIKCNDFYSDDQSSVQDAIGELLNQMKMLSEEMSEVDFMIDNLFHIINSGILDEEDKIAANVSED